MKTIDLIQGSPEWHAHRAAHFNASDAPAMMGCSPYMTRTELLTRMKTGVAPEVDEGTQRVFDAGHRFEALARPLAEAIIGEDLYAVTGTRGKLSASFDGLTMLEDMAFEHKSLNESLRYTPWDEGNGDHLPIHYRVQMEHQMIVSGARVVLFMASRWDGDTMAEERHCWYSSDAELRRQILAGWEQFERDLAEFVPPAIEAPKPTGKAPESLPALRIAVTGAVTASNLAEFKAQAMAVFQGISRDLQTDADFADAEATVKWAKGIEDRLASAKESALAQTESIDALFRAIDDISAEARRVRLDLDKLVKARKDEKKAEIVEAGRAALANHITELNAGMPADYMPQVPADFGGCIKSLRTLESIRNAVDTELARAKIAAGEIATRIHANLRHAANNIAKELLPDLATLVLKAPDDFAAVIAQRKAAEVAREEAQRERIRAEEAARLESEALAQAVATAPVDDVVDADIPAGTVIVATGPRVVIPLKLGPECGTTADDDRRLKLGQINAYLAPIQITAAGLSQLGFDPVGKDKSAVLYRESDFPAICQAIAKHAMGAVALA